MNTQQLEKYIFKEWGDPLVKLSNLFLDKKEISSNVFLDFLDKNAVELEKKSKYDLGGIIHLTGMNAERKKVKFDYDKGLDLLLKYDKTGDDIFYSGVPDAGAIISGWSKFNYDKAIKVLKKIGGVYYKRALEEWPKGIKQSIAKTKKLEKTSKKLPFKKLKLEEVKLASEIYRDGRVDKIYDLDALIKADKKGGYIYSAGKDWEKFNYNKGLDALIKKDKVGEWIYLAGKNWKQIDYNKALKVLKKISDKSSYKSIYKYALKNWPKGIDISIAKTKKLEKTSKKLPFKKLKLEDTKLKSAEQIYQDGCKGKYGLDALIKVDKTGEWIYYAGVDWKKFDFSKGLDALIKADKYGNWIYGAERDWKKFDYNKALKALKQISNKHYKFALKNWPKGIDQSQAKIKQLEKTSKKLPMRKLKINEMAIQQIPKGKFEEWAKKRVDSTLINAGKANMSNFDYDKALEIITSRKNKGYGWNFIAIGKYWKNKIDYNEVFELLVKNTNKLNFMYRMYEVENEWDLPKNFDYKKALSIIRKEYNEKKWVEILKGYENLHKAWFPLKYQIKKTKELERTSKKLPFKKLKLESVKKFKTAKQIYYDGLKGKCDFDALLKADKTGQQIFGAGCNWKKFDYKKGLDALIERSKKGEWIYYAGSGWWKEFNYEKGLKKLKQIGGEWYKYALKKWPKGIEQSQAKIKQLEKTSKKLPMKKLKIGENKMNFKEKVRFHLNETKDPDRVHGGYKAMATRLSNDLNKKISPAQVKKYLSSLEKTKTAKGIKKRAEGATSSGSYEWKTKYKIMLGHFAKQ